MKVIIDTTPNGHFKRSIEITKEEESLLFKKAKPIVKCDSGFNMFKIKDGILHIGYNHSGILQWAI